MKTTLEHIRALGSAIERPTDGVIGLVDELLKAASTHGLEFDWHGNHCRARSIEAGWEESIDLPIRLSVFRAMLARLAALCNERSPNSVSPYGGQCELSVGADPPVRISIDFVNTVEQQKLELIPVQQMAENMGLAGVFTLDEIARENLGK